MLPPRKTRGRASSMGRGWGEITTVGWAVAGAAAMQAIRTAREDSRADNRAGLFIVPL
jgi:hypothetical protein